MIVSEGAEQLRMIRRGLGVSREWLAARLGVAERTIARWEDGQIAIRPGVWTDLAAIEHEHAEHARKGVPAGDDWPPGWRQSVAWRRRIEHL